MSEEAQNEAPQTNFDIQKIYLKDVSFESPNAPSSFQVEWKPDTNLQVGSKNTKLAEDVYEVVLSLTATVKVGEQTAFLIEIQQAGIFTLAGFEEGALGHLVGAYCPNLLFPYAREAISDLTTKGGFPPLLLAPINFDALYAQNQQQSDSPETETKH